MERVDHYQSERSFGRPLAATTQTRPEAAPWKMKVPVRILVMDDAPVVRRLIVRLLDDFNGVDQVLQAENASSAVALAAEHKPQIAILDIKVPGGPGLRNGIDVLKAIKRSNPNAHVIMLTNQSTPLYRQESERAGAIYFFDKSSEFDRVPDVVQDLVRRLSGHGH